MDLSLTRDTVPVSDTVLETSVEHPVDCDIILPDYCPDIARILKTEAGACVNSKKIDAGTLSLSGILRIKIIYIPENSRQIRCVTHEEPFTHNFDLREPAENATVMAKARAGYCNCRPLGPRRLQVRTGAALAVRVSVQREENFISGCEDGQIEMLKKPIKASVLVGAVERDFKVEDELEVGYGKPAVASVVKTEAVAVLQDYKVISNKVIAKGEILLHTVYVGEAENEEDSGRLEVMDHNVPLSQIVDLEGVDEDCVCDVRFAIVDIKAEAAADSDGENRLLAVELTLTASARAYRAEEFEVVTDAYSTEYESAVKTKKLSFENIVDTVKATEMIRDSIDLTGMDVAGVTDCIAKPETVSCRCEGNALFVEGSLLVSVLATDSQGGPSNVDKSLPFKIQEDLKENAEGKHCDPEFTVLSSGYSMLGTERLDLRIECAVEGIVFGAVTEGAVVELEADEEKPRECPGRKTLTIYYADRNERIWDIAKRYNTSADAIKKENNLTEDQLGERSMLLIPKKRCVKP